MKTKNTLLAFAFLIASLSFGQITTDSGTGNVGIGTTIPSQKLSIYGNMSLDTGGYIYGDTTTPYLRLSQTNGSFLAYANSGIGLYGSLADIYSTDNITFRTNNVERMRIIPTGNILMGTDVSNGIDRLQVNGSISTISINLPANQILHWVQVGIQENYL